VDLKIPYTVYTRLQKAGSPITFSNYFGYQQKDIKGKSIAGSDEHLLKAVIRDTTGVTYAPVSLLFDPQTGKPIQGLTILPVDLNGNGKVSDDEKFYEDLNKVIQHLEEKNQKEINNVPIEYLNLSVEKNNPNSEAVLFIQWIVKNGEGDLHTFGFLKPESEKRNEQP
jgi:phosphate transport system substrate-binding protein